MATHKNTLRPSDPLLTVAECVEYSGFSPKTIRRWIDREHLPVVRFGPRFVRVRKSDLDGLMQSGIDG